MLLKYNNIEDVLDNFFKVEQTFNNTSNHKIEHDENGATLIMNVPGYNKKLIDVSVDGDLLVVEGKVNSGDSDGFTRKFNLGDTYDVDGIEASVVDGVLTLSLPYLEEIKPKQVKVKVK
jgi:HSP20 family molecular chaperone IbpA